jgi:hypothetical protein
MSGAIERYNIAKELNKQLQKNIISLQVNLLELNNLLTLNNLELNKMANTAHISYPAVYQTKEKQDLFASGIQTEKLELPSSHMTWKGKPRREMPTDQDKTKVVK